MPYLPLVVEVYWRILPAYGEMWVVMESHWEAINADVGEQCEADPVTRSNATSQRRCLWRPQFSATAELTIQVDRQKKMEEIG
jgi:hypothetical protein